ncbi:unnamed protein product [Dovyalis caffra]|uniref:Uncharacterized protein n=1 Tax=Dovyalis caffra TaxID=77055 RepID=A0AAV1SKW2_9ROSI|nr:unnamed protein product [Dovyalis caffra]
MGRMLYKRSYVWEGVNRFAILDNLIDKDSNDKDSSEKHLVDKDETKIGPHAKRDRATINESNKERRLEPIS